jgi:hypothetical protein
MKDSISLILIVSLLMLLSCGEKEMSLFILSEGLFIQKGVLPYTPIVVFLSTDGSKISYTEFDEFLDIPTESLIND